MDQKMEPVVDKMNRTQLLHALHEYYPNQSQNSIAKSLGGVAQLRSRLKELQNQATTSVVDIQKMNRTQLLHALHEYYPNQSQNSIAKSLGGVAQLRSTLKQLQTNTVETNELQTETIELQTNIVEPNNVELNQDVIEQILIQADFQYIKTYCLTLKQAT